MPRSGAGASRAAIACDVGIHSISPTTNTAITAAITGTDAAAASTSSGRPISAIAAARRIAGGTPDVARVSLSWNSTTSSGLIASSSPQPAAGTP